MKINRRRFIERVAQAGLGLGAASTLWRSSSSAAFAAQTKDKPLKLCMVSGSEEYKSNESLAAFQELVEKKFPSQMQSRVLEIENRIARPRCFSHPAT